MQHIVCPEPELPLLKTRQRSRRAGDVRAGEVMSELALFGLELVVMPDQVGAGRSWAGASVCTKTALAATLALQCTNSFPSFPQ